MNQNKNGVKFTSKTPSYEQQTNSVEALTLDRTVQELSSFS